MNNNLQNNLATYIMAVGSTALVTGACIFFIAFLGQFVQYTMDLLFLASSETHQYLHIVPLH